MSDRTLAPFGRRLLTVTANDPLGAYRVLRVADPGGPEPVAGQFAMIAASERWGGGEDDRPCLPRAFSYARFTDGEAHFLLEDVGPGTRRLCELRAGEGLWLLGPLGRGFEPPPQPSRALLVGGGVGIAPLAILQDSLTGRTGSAARIEAGPASRGAALGTQGAGRPMQAEALLGFRDRVHAEGVALLEPGAQLATDDGSLGHRGLVTELLERELERDRRATVYACGPPAMLEAVRALCERCGVAAQLALEAGMACGFGACYGCVVPARAGGYLRVCVDGPVLDAAQLAAVSSHTGAAA